MLTDSAKTILRRTPGPADVEQLAIMHLITSEYRNGKTHPVSGSRHIFTSRHEMQALRKLVFGIDEEKTVQKKEIVDRIKRTSWLTNLETGRAMDRVWTDGESSRASCPSLGRRSAEIPPRDGNGPLHQFHQFQKVEKIVKQSEI